MERSLVELKSASFNIKLVDPGENAHANASACSSWGIQKKENHATQLGIHDYCQSLVTEQSGYSKMTYILATLVCVLSPPQ